MIYFKFTIADLRQIFPNDKLGNRERTILHEKGARVLRTHTQDTYRVRGKESYFEFTYKGKNNPNNFIVTN